VCTHVICHALSQIVVDVDAQPVIALGPLGPQPPTTTETTTSGTTTTSTTATAPTTTMSTMPTTTSSKHANTDALASDCHEMRTPAVRTSNTGGLTLSSQTKVSVCQVVVLTVYRALGHADARVWVVGDLSRVVGECLSASAGHVRHRRKHDVLSQVVY
jgi:hypothetical protein